ncbi:MAG TPA: MFS transporter [Thermoplasmata archaeon]|nr:MFS transporter [Thermoplasmata archaeon]
MNPTSYQELFRNRNYLRVFGAGLGSIAGSAIASVCIVWITASVTGSPFDVALLAIAQLIPAIVFSTLGGTLVDRYNRRRLMVISDLARGGALAFAAIVLAVYGFNLPVLLFASVVLGAFTVLFNPAEQAIVPALVPAPQVADANGLIRSSRSSLQFVGVAIGGVLVVVVGPVWGIAANAATFALSASLLTGLAVSDRLASPRALEEKESYFAELRAGFAWLYAAKGFFQLTISALFFNFASTLIATFVVFYATYVLHGSALVYSGLLAAEVAGTALGSLLVGRLGAARYAGKAWVVPYGAVSGGVALALALVPNVPVSIVTFFTLGLLAGFAGTAWLTAAQLLVPTGMQGRYFGVDALGSAAILPAAELIGAFLIGLFGVDSFGVRTTFLIAAIVWIVVGVAFLVPRALWNLSVPAGATSRSADDEAGTPGSPGGSRVG